MKYCRFSAGEGAQYGLVERVAGTEQITHTLPLDATGLPDIKKASRIAALPLAAAALLAPVEPSKIVCVGRNYSDHAKELGNEVPTEPLLFLKPPSSIIASGRKIVRPRLSQNVHFEGELSVVIKKPCRNPADSEDMRPYVFGYTCANDVTARDLQKKDGQFTRGKGFDTFCPIGPVVSDDPDPWKGVQLETRVNGEVKQSGSTRDFIFALDVVIRYIANVMTLLPGDLILTGTPAGVGPLMAGDVVEVSVEGIGTLKNAVIDEGQQK
jgi:2-keto-4-pentenoate hydratase/2-oxohepta-3-ene-1,7-dioic acid hydratase in catechol pathway